VLLKIDEHGMSGVANSEWRVENQNFYSLLTLRYSLFT
jgi:hypothetical protein